MACNKIIYYLFIYLFINTDHPVASEQHKAELCQLDRKAKIALITALNLKNSLCCDLRCLGQPCRFVVVTTGAGSGPLAVMVEGPAKVAVVCTEVDEGYEFTYTPTAPGDYYIIIKYCNVTIAGCPHKAVITGDYN